MRVTKSKNLQQTKNENEKRGKLKIGECLGVCLCVSLVSNVCRFARLVVCASVELMVFVRFIIVLRFVFFLGILIQASSIPSHSVCLKMMNVIWMVPLQWFWHNIFQFHFFVCGIIFLGRVGAAAARMRPWHRQCGHIVATLDVNGGHFQIRSTRHCVMAHYLNFILDSI